MPTVSQHIPEYNNPPAPIHPIRPGIQEDRPVYDAAPKDKDMDDAPSFVVAVDVDVTRAILGTLGANAYGVYALLETYCNENGDAWPSIDTLVRETQLSDQTVRNLTAKLIEKKWITRTKRLNRFGVHAGYTYHLPNHIKPRTNEGQSSAKVLPKFSQNTTQDVPPEVSTRYIQGKDQENNPPLPPKPRNYTDTNPAPGFAEFYAAYPRKEKRPSAIRAWNKIAPDPDTQRAMIATVEQRKQSNGWRKNNGQYVPLPATWLNDRCWEDQLTVDVAVIDDRHWTDKLSDPPSERAEVFPPPPIWEDASAKRTVGVDASHDEEEF